MGRKCVAKKRRSFSATFNPEILEVAKLLAACQGLKLSEYLESLVAENVIEIRIGGKA